MIAIIISLVILVVLTFKKVNVLLSAPIAAAVLIVLNKLPLISTLTNDYAGGAADFIQSVWLMILLGAVFGKLMDETGAAAAIAKLIIDLFGVKRAPVAVILASGLLAYGGIQSMVIVFTLYPITLTLFKKGNLPRALIPGVIGAGSFTFANMLPGSPQALNVIPTTYLGTTVMAAPLLGVVSAAATFIMIYFYFKFVFRKEKEKGNHFISDASIERTIKKAEDMENDASLPNPWIALIPPAIVLITLNLLGWDILAALVTGCILCIVLFFRNMPDILETLSTGSTGAAVAVLNTAAVIGVGTVIRNTDGFQKIVDAVLNFGGNPLAAFGAATSILSGVTASGTGGISITLESLAEPFLNMGVNAEALHRIGTIACCGLDSLPYSGGIVTLLTVTGISHKEGYKHLFATTVVITTITLVIAVILGAVLYPVV